jgi:hypothetical protein
LNRPYQLCNKQIMNQIITERSMRPGFVWFKTHPYAPPTFSFYCGMGPAIITTLIDQLKYFHQVNGFDGSDLT